MSNADKMRRHLGDYHEICLGDDVFRVKPLSVEHLPSLYGAVIRKIDFRDEANIIESLDAEVMSNATELIRKMLSTSPDIDATDESLLNDFISANYVGLFMALIESNLPSVDERDKQNILKIKQKNATHIRHHKQAKKEEV